MANFEINGHNYTSVKMNAFTQFHIARRLTPIFSSLAEAFKKVKFDKEGKIENPIDIFEPVAQAFSALKDTDADYVLHTCLATCQRQNNNLWSNVMSGGNMMFQDIDLQIMLQITWNVLQDNFASFFSGQLGPTSA